MSPLSSRSNTADEIPVNFVGVGGALEGAGSVELDLIFFLSGSSKELNTSNSYSNLINGLFSI